MRTKKADKHFANLLYLLASSVQPGAQAAPRKKGAAPAV